MWESGSGIDIEILRVRNSHWYFRISHKYRRPKYKTILQNTWLWFMVTKKLQISEYYQNSRLALSPECSMGTTSTAWPLNWGRQIIFFLCKKPGSSRISRVPDMIWADNSLGQINCDNDIQKFTGSAFSGDEGSLLNSRIECWDSPDGSVIL